MSAFSERALLAHPHPFLNVADSDACLFPHPHPALGLAIQPRHGLPLLETEGPTKLSNAWADRHRGIMMPPAVAVQGPRRKLCQEVGACICRGENSWRCSFFTRSRDALKAGFPAGSVAAKALADACVIATFQPSHPDCDHEQPSSKRQRSSEEGCASSSTVPSREREDRELQPLYFLASLQYLKPWRTTWLALQCVSANTYKADLTDVGAPTLLTHLQLTQQLDGDVRWTVSFSQLAATEEPVVSMIHFHAIQSRQLALRQLLCGGEELLRGDNGHPFSGTTLL